MQICKKFCLTQKRLFYGKRREFKAKKMKFKGENLLGKRAVAVLLMSFCALVGDESLINAQNLNENFIISAEKQSTNKFIANLNENSATLINTATPANTENSATLANPESIKGVENPTNNANALDENVSSVNLAQDELNLNKNSATLTNAINSEPATLTNTENSATLTNNASTENNATPENSSDESDFGFDEFEAEFESFKVNDPLSGYNKMMTRFNVALYTYALRPIAKGYEFVMPEFARLGIKNFASYINMPIRFLGNVLQLKFKEAGTELKRFGVNTIFGFFGLIDAASKAQIPLHHADFGLVLAHWGVGGGFHFVLPVLGPSNLRDTLSIPVNWYASPITYAATYDSSAWINWLSVGITSFVMINEASLNTPTLDEIFYKTPNLYPFLRDAYEKRRMEMAK